jgi:tryptophanyl-tRNA synthetase
LAQIEDYKNKYRNGKIGDVEVKKFLAKILNDFLEPIRQRRLEYEKQPGLLNSILKEGTAKVKEEAQKTLNEVKEKMGLMQNLIF